MLQGVATASTRRVTREVVAGFTLLEVMLAVTIMALISIAVINVFNVATDSFKSGNRETLVLQRARFIFDTLDADLKQIHFEPETSYNVNARTEIEKHQQLMLEAEETNDFDQFEKIYGEKDERNENDPEHIGNPFEKFVLIDLQFIGEDGEDFDTATFSTKTSLSEGARYFPYGTKRVRYAVDGGFLIRTEDSIKAAPRDWLGEIQEKEVPPEHTILAKGVEKFDLQYGFWVDNSWFEANSWNSAGKQIRNSNFILGDYDFEEEGTADNFSSTDANIGFGSDGWNDSLNDARNEPFDGLPAYIRISVTLRDPEDENGKKLNISKILQVPGSTETWYENDKLEEDERENEVILRRDEYLEVFPGALKKR